MEKYMVMAAKLTGFVFILTGIGWFLIPDFVAGQLGMPLLTGVGLSTQMADLASFFLTIGICILAGFRTGNGFWFYPPVILLTLAAIGRILAWLLFDATLAAHLILPEVVVAALLYHLSGKLGSDKR